MRDVIQKIMAAEAEAKTMTLAARTEAERILAETQKRAKELTESARKEVQLEAEEILATAVKDAEKDKQARIAAVAAEIEKQVRLDEADRQQAVAAVVRCVCG